MLLVKTAQNKRIIACPCPRSSAQGVRTGMTLAHARALITRQPIIEAEHDPVHDDLALRQLAGWAIRFAPIVAVDPPDGLTLDVTGCDRLYPGERRMLNAIGNSLERLGISNRVCVASTVAGAWACARFRNDERTIVPAGSERVAIEPLPIEALRIDAETAQALHEVNIDRVGEVLALPRLELAARFSSTLLERIDQALGETAEVIETLHPAEPIAVERVFSGAVTNLESLFIVGRELIEEAAAELLRRESGALRIDVTLTRLDAVPIVLSCRLSRPSRDVKHLFSLLKPKLETVNMGYGIERVELFVTAAKRIAHRQRTEFGQAQHDSPLDHAAGELIDTLSQRLGAERALRLQVRETHVPERAAKLTPAMNDAVNGSAHARAALVDADRPSQLLARPELIEVMAITPDGPPVWLRWRGSEHRIASAAGPERVSGEWWTAGLEDADDKWRDYFKVQDERGRWLWIFRAQHTRRWFAHGEWA